MVSIADTERAALCDLLDELGPDAPTLCEGWTTRDMAVHLYVRDRDPKAWAGISVGRPGRDGHSGHWSAGGRKVRVCRCEAMATHSPSRAS